MQDGANRRTGMTAHHKSVRKRFTDWRKTIQWKRWVIIVTCLGLAVARLIWPDVKIDASTVWLVGIAAIMYALPDLLLLLPNFKKLKFWDIELEMAEKEVKKLEQEVSAAQEATSNDPTAVVPETVDIKIAEVLNDARVRPWAALLVLSNELEQQVMKRVEEINSPLNKRVMPLYRAIDLGVANGKFTPETASALKSFWRLRNQIAHTRVREVDEGTILPLISLGLDLLKVLAAERVD
jgi:hypothetical protein